MKLFIGSILLVGTLFTITSCQHRAIKNKQAMIDSIVHAKVENISQELTVQCDSTIMQMARTRADSILKSPKK